MHLHDPDHQHDHGVGRTQADQQGVERLLILRHQVGNSRRCRGGRHHGKQGVTRCDQDVFKPSLSVHQAGHRPVADAEDEIQQNDACQLRRQVHGAGLNIVDNKAGRDPVHGEHDSVQEHHQEGDPQAALFLMPDPVIPVCRMADRMEKMLPFVLDSHPVHDGSLLFPFLRIAGRTAFTQSTASAAAATTPERIRLILFRSRSFLHRLKATE